MRFTTTTLCTLLSISAVALAIPHPPKEYGDNDWKPTGKKEWSDKGHNGGDNGGNGGGTSLCSNGGGHCCNSVTSLADMAENTIGSLTSLLGIPLNDLNLNVGLGCGVLGGNCQQQAVCCNNVHFDGLINLGCSPINIL
ncbi:fungal hydrophobin sc3-like protein [Moniliophthora roreri MCA 2997]|uniref:Hydrophobin n=1 Tax=Moniliophthora roreri (strain MCA 2997) TaxID=1381753 RepID=V2XZB2_MONRO|nr:fungal hydrophobin sc3-like protein [Moniliophthora roreri MCA 2997]